MASIAAFSKFLAYEVGGAEKSTRALLAEAAGEGTDVTLVSAAAARFLGQPVQKAAMPAAWQQFYLDDLIQLARFGYVEYLLNRGRIRRWFSRLEADELWAFGLWAPAAMLDFPGRKRYFVRSESDLGIVGNYFQGARRWLKQGYTWMEQPARALHWRDLRAAIRDATITANSAYMARRTRECLGIAAEVLYPVVDVEPMRHILATGRREPRWIVFVGDNNYKGLPLVLSLARQLPELPFRIFSRFVSAERQEGNILWSPWQTEVWRVYEAARLVIVPSQWEEAYGRVAREAHLLNLPLLVSDVGGLPESVDHDPGSLVSDFRSPKAWRQAIKDKLRA